MNIVGIDPSLAATGIAFADGSTATVKEKGYTGDKRLILIYMSVRAAVEGADAVIIEDLPTNAMGAGLTGRSQGVVRLVLQQLGVPYIAIPASTLKKAATGKGNAKKAAMAEVLEEMIGADDSRVNLKDDNRVDAFFLHQCGRYLFMGRDFLLTDPTALDGYQEEADAIKEVVNERAGASRQA